MADNTALRRRVLFAAALATLLPLESSGQEAESRQAGLEPLGNAKEAGNHHWRALDELTERLGGATPASEQGLHRLVALLVSRHAITEQQGSILDQLVTKIFHGTTSREIYEAVESVAKTVEEHAESLMTAILKIADASITRARKMVNDADTRRVVHILAKDLYGAMTGAGAAALLIKVPAPAVLIAGAVIGSVATSFDAYYSDAPKT
jgi:hypothetical protein